MKMRARSLAAWRAFMPVIGYVWRKATTGGEAGWLDEIVLLVALVLVTVALWPLATAWAGSGYVALLPAGLVGLWIAIPARAPLVLRPTVPEKPARRPS